MEQVIAPVEPQCGKSADGLRYEHGLLLVIRLPDIRVAGVANLIEPTRNGCPVVGELVARSQGICIGLEPCCESLCRGGSCSGNSRRIIVEET